MWRYRPTGISRRRSRRDATMQESMHSDAVIVESEMCDYSSYNWNHVRFNESLKKNLAKILGKHSIDSWFQASAAMLYWEFMQRRLIESYMNEDLIQ
jgi:hypothetical protein